MKKIIFIVLCLCMAITSYASPEDIYQINYEDLGITIIFEEDTIFTNDERKYIADCLVYGTNSPEDSSTYAWCWLTGHDYTYDAVTSIEHKVSANAPRCLETTYQVETCTKCDHLETTVLASVYINCCPED